MDPRPMTEGTEAEPLPSFWRVATSAAVVRIGLRTSVVIGTLLNAINHPEFFLGIVGGENALPIVLNYVVPYMVASYGATSHATRAKG